MQNLKIRVSNEAESREAQELLFKLNLEKSNWSNFSLPKFIAARIAENNFSDYILGDVGMYKYKEITLPELRAMVNPMKEYIDAKRNYEFVISIEKEEGFIEIPDGAEILAETRNGLVFYKKHTDRFGYCFAGETEWGGTFTNPYDEIGAFVCGFLWQRESEQDEPFLTPECTLNEQYAEIEEVRQLEIHGTVKAKPDFNFGAAEASGGAKEKGSTPSSAWDTQVGGNHYKQFKIQPMQFALENKLDAAQQNVIKYIMRHSFKNGKQDLEKAKHYIDLMIEFYYGENNNG